MRAEKEGLDIPFPPEWEPQTETVQLFQVARGTPEWLKVQEAFGKTMNPKSLVKIERVQNKFLWRNFVNERETVMIRNGEINEKLLFHGTRANNPSEIYGGDEGFDTRFCFAGMWGRGNYFATAARFLSFHFCLC